MIAHLKSLNKSGHLLLLSPYLDLNLTLKSSHFSPPNTNFVHNSIIIHPKTLPTNELTYYIFKVYHHPYTYCNSKRFLLLYD